MHDLRTTFAERWLKLQVEVGPPPGSPGAPLPGARPGGRGSVGGLPLRGSGPRRPTPMVATKAEADGLISAPDAAGAKPQSAQVAAIAPNPYAGVGRNDPCPCGSGKKFKKCHGAGL